MAKYIICDKCKKLIEYNPITEHKIGMTFTKLICPKCGYVKETNVNHIHYGNDGKKL